MSIGLLIGCARKSGSLTIAQQVEMLTRSGCKLRDIYQEELDRADAPGLKKALRATRDGDVFVVPSLICLARSRNQIVSLLRYFRENDIHLWSIEDLIDTRGEFGELIIPTLLEVMNKRRDELKELTSRGLVKARAKGRIGGRPSALSNAKKAEATRLLELQQFSMADVARQLGVARGTLYNAGLNRSRSTSRRAKKEKTTR